MRESYAAIGVSWPDLDYQAGLEQRNLLTNTYVEALRVLAPDSGAYQNEVHCPAGSTKPLLLDRHADCLLGR